MWLSVVWMLKPSFALMLTARQLASAMASNGFEDLRDCIGQYVDASLKKDPDAAVHLVLCCIAWLENLFANFPSSIQVDLPWTQHWLLQVKNTICERLASHNCGDHTLVSYPQASTASLAKISLTLMDELIEVIPRMTDWMLEQPAEWGCKLEMQLVSGKDIIMKSFPFPQQAEFMVFLKVFCQRLHDKRHKWKLGSKMRCTKFGFWQFAAGSPKGERVWARERKE